MKVLAIIPSRYHSQRLHAKAMLPVGGKSIIRLTYEQACKSDKLSEVYVATDSEIIFDEIVQNGGKALMTSNKHENGTSRCLEAAKILGTEFDFLLNIQGDQPTLNPLQIDLLISHLKSNTQIATLGFVEKNIALIQNPNIVKVVLNHQNQAMYFSRSPIPYLRDFEHDLWTQKHNFIKHIGIYAFHKNIIKTLEILHPTSLENAERLEQLRWLANNLMIDVVITPYDNISIDTKADLMG